MQSPELFALYVDRLNGARIPFVITGSVASIVYGEPRVTLDIDLVVDLKPDRVDAFISVFPAEEFYVPPQEVLEQEMRRPSKGNASLVHHKTGFKADLFFAGADILQRWAIQNARWIDHAGSRLPVAPAEYVIVKKIEYFVEGGSEKHLRDIAAILSISGESVDNATVRRFLSGNAMLKIWDALLKGEMPGKAPRKDSA